MSASVQRASASASSSIVVDRLVPLCMEAANAAETYATEPFYAGDLSLYTGFRHPQGWERQRVRQFLSREFTRHPAVAPILRRDPPFFTSNHAPLFAMAGEQPCRECA